MSDLISLLQITPPAESWVKSEVKQVVKTCPTCHGAGVIREAQGYHGSDRDNIKETTCSNCKGFKKLRADIVIRWSPDEPKIE